jgi:hypothetical protein
MKITFMDFSALLDTAVMGAPAGRIAGSGLIVSVRDLDALFQGGG